jgi:hypothetical protein
VSVYAEWFWSCDRCDDVAEEAFGNQYDAEDALIDHMKEVHPEGVSR